MQGQYICWDKQQGLSLSDPPSAGELEPSWKGHSGTTEWACWAFFLTAPRRCRGLAVTENGPMSQDCGGPSARQRGGAFF